MQQIIVDFGERVILGIPMGLRIYGYGLMMVLGFLLGIALARWRARRFGENPDTFTTMGLLCLVSGVAGARIAYVIERWDSQFSRMENPLPAMLNITSGGLIFFGGVGMAVLTIVAYLAIKRLPMRRYLDIITPSLMLGLMFGRLGCLLNGCCFGGPCSDQFALAAHFPYASQPLVHVGPEGNLFGAASVSPAFAHQTASMTDEQLLARYPRWLFQFNGADQILRTDHREAIIVSPGSLTPAQAAEAANLRSGPIQPTQALSALDALLVCILLLAFSRLRKREGQVFLLMLTLYPVLRFLEESLRGDNPHDLWRLQLTHNQWTSLAMLPAGVILWLLLRYLPASAGPVWRDRLTAVASHSSDSMARKKGRRL